MENPKTLWRWALILCFITVFYNIAEGIISVYFGLDDDTLALLGFGLDSFVEVISGLGILHLIVRMMKQEVNLRDRFEKIALYITGTCFYLLTIGLVISAGWNIYVGAMPETTLPGIIIALISLATMYWLMKAKLSVGQKLESNAIIADAHCTKTCFQLSIVLLLASGFYEIFHIGYIDSIGSILISWFAFKEGRETFQKARSQSLDTSCCCSDDCH